MKKQGIYQIVNLKNKKCYVGSSLNLDKRLYEHKRLLKLGKHENNHLQNAWNKYGEDSFEFKIIEIIDVIEDYDENNRFLRERETYYIELYKASDPNFGYNFLPGGIGTQGLPCSEEKKIKISEANKGREAYNKGIPMSEEQKEILREINSEKYGKSIDIYTANKVFLETLPSIRDVHRKYGTARNTIRDCCLNLTNPKGLIFRFHGDSLDTVGSLKSQRSQKDLEETAKQYRKSHGKAIDIYDSYGIYIETLPAVVEVHEKYKLSETTIRRGLKEKVISGGKYFRYAGEELGDISDSIKYNSKSVKNNNLAFSVYSENNIFIESIKYKKDIEEKYALPREKSKLQRLLSQCKNTGDNFKYHNFLIKLELAPRNSDISSASRQLDNVIKGTNNSANGEA